MQSFKRQSQRNTRSFRYHCKPNMALEATHPLPLAEDFTRLSEHQQETPNSFFGGKPVLHLRSPNAKIKISREDLTAQPALAALGTAAAINASIIDGVATIEGVDVWVSSTFVNHHF